jgi:hypothetical protein
MFLQCVSSYPVPEGFDASRASAQVAEATRRRLRLQRPHARLGDGHARLRGRRVHPREAPHLRRQRHRTRSRRIARRTGLREVLPRRPRATFKSGRWGSRRPPARKQLLAAEQDVRLVSRQSLVTTRRSAEGHVLTPGDPHGEATGHGASSSS